MSQKYFLYILFLVIGLCLYSGRTWAQSTNTNMDVGQQAQKLAEQEKKLIWDYKRQRVQLEAQLQQKLRPLTQSPADRARRRQLMEEANQKLSQLQESFKVNMDSIKAAESNLIPPQTSLEISNTGDSVKRTDPEQLLLQKQRQRALQERIRKQDDILLKEKGNLYQQQNNTFSQPSSQGPSNNERSGATVSADQSSSDNSSSSIEKKSEKNRKKKY